MDEFEKILERYDNLYREMMLIYLEWSKANGVSHNETIILTSLYCNPKGYSQKEICDAFLLPKQTVNTIVRELEKCGYVKGVPESADKRKKSLLLTSDGYAHAKNVVPKLRALEETVFKKMGKDGSERLLNSMEEFVRFFREGL